MPATPIQRLQKAIRAITDDGNPGQVVKLARAFGIDGLCGRRAASGKYVKAGDYLRLCAAVGIDPATGAACEAKELPELDWGLVALRIRLELAGSPEDPRSEKMPMRRAAKEWGLPLVILGRMKAGEPASIDNLLALSAALGCHPHAFMKSVPPDVSVKQQAERIDLSQIAKVLA